VLLVWIFLVWNIVQINTKSYKPVVLMLTKMVDFKKRLSIGTRCGISSLKHTVDQHIKFPQQKLCVPYQLDYVLLFLTMPSLNSRLWSSQSSFPPFCSVLLSTKVICWIQYYLSRKPHFICSIIRNRKT
jgi:hypothetical protein